ncbi:alkylation response protein AidB-like acyl-CoA dehydrogenase [Sphingomonas insulae]|uniref:Acyl-CoA dehydrogenase n=1 Tax=Sphingomonas insulae TaxID=424800 RepID=A0ABP3T0G0_9SPHN|nr:acyl-CoA dehydrogenase [Sphingomonas insulae]NIJ29407.1 alkylation response protein AidB-like acyl-CoA dehydrogenase [Sphingomonas insulae]
MTDTADLLRAAIATAGWDRDAPRDPDTPGRYLSLLTVLYAMGRRDLPLGRLLEGHVDAVQIVRRYGTAAQVDRLLAALAAGAMLGVWNAGLAGEPLVLADDGLRGGKSYASGAGVLTHALVTADTADGARLLLVDLANVPPMVDRHWWRMTGMQRSETHRVRWSHAAVGDDALIGAPGDYAREPFFGGGALRFVAVHAGGIAGLCDRVRDHLIATDRVGDPFQAARLAEIFCLADTAASIVRRTAVDWFEQDDAARLPRVAAARLAVTDAAERALALAQQSVGLTGHFLDHPLAAMLTDLAVYLRQPAPDGQRLRVGAAVAAGHLVPSL